MTPRSRYESDRSRAHRRSTAPDPRHHTSNGPHPLSSSPNPTCMRTYNASLRPDKFLSLSSSHRESGAARQRKPAPNRMCESRRRPPSSSPSNILAAQMPRGHSSIFSSTFQALWLPNRYRAYQKWSTPALNEQAESLCASPEAAPTQAQLTSSTDCCSERSRPPPAAS